MRRQHVIGDSDPLFGRFSSSNSAFRPYLQEYNSMGLLSDPSSPYDSFLDALAQPGTPSSVDDDRDRDPDFFPPPHASPPPNVPPPLSAHRISVMLEAQASIVTQLIIQTHVLASTWKSEKANFILRYTTSLLDGLGLSSVPRTQILTSWRRLITDPLVEKPQDIRNVRQVLTSLKCLVDSNIVPDKTHGSLLPVAKKRGNSTESAGIKFCPAEDKLVRIAIAKYGSLEQKTPKKWEDIVGSLLPARSPAQVMSRYHKICSKLDELDILHDIDVHTRKQGDWSPHERVLLIKGYTALGNSWAQITKDYLPHRNRQAVYREFKRIMALDKKQNFKISEETVSCKEIPDISSDDRRGIQESSTKQSGEPSHSKSTQTVSKQKKRRMKGTITNIQSRSPTAAKSGTVERTLPNNESFFPKPGQPTTKIATLKRGDSCLGCRSLKCKCSREKPLCSRCRKRGIECKYPEKECGPTECLLFKPVPREPAPQNTICSLQHGVKKAKTNDLLREESLSFDNCHSDLNHFESTDAQNSTCHSLQPVQQALPTKPYVFRTFNQAKYSHDKSNNKIAPNEHSYSLDLFNDIPKISLAKDIPSQSSDCVSHQTDFSFGSSYDKLSSNGVSRCVQIPNASTSFKFAKPSTPNRGNEDQSYSKVNISKQTVFGGQFQSPTVPGTLSHLSQPFDGQLYKHSNDNSMAMDFCKRNSNKTPSEVTAHVASETKPSDFTFGVPSQSATIMIPRRDPMSHPMQSLSDTTVDFLHPQPATQHAPFLPGAFSSHHQSYVHSWTKHEDRVLIVHWYSYGNPENWDWNALSQVLSPVCIKGAIERFVFLMDAMNNK